jgi:hypothetical protein
MENRAFGVLATALLCLCAYASAARAEPLRVLYAEPFQAQTLHTPGAQKPGPASPANLRVQAFNRTFELQLEDNGRLLRATSAATRARFGAIQLLKGTIKDAPGSWVRLTLNQGRYSGAFWDGSELYAIAPREAIDSASLTPMRPGATGIYRLSDTQGGLFDGTCAVAGSATPSASPIAKFRSLIGELRAAADTAFAAAPREVEVSMIGDFEFTTRFGSGAAQAMLDRMNVVDGIFSSQVGVTTIPTDFITFPANTDPFTSSEPSTLLEQLGNYRNATAVVRSRGLAHLLTGRQLNGDIVGIAYLGSVCTARNGAGLTEVSSFIDSPLVMAHELGHNFGAPHDGEAGSPCVNTPQTFLMAPEIGFSSEFSACSLQQMETRLQTASCVVAARNRDLAVSTPTERLQAIANTPFDVTFDLTSVGDTDAVNVVLTVFQPFNLTVLSASMPGAVCTVQFGENTRCELPALAAGASTRLTLRASYASVGEQTFRAAVVSSNDVNSGNDQAFVRVDNVAERAMQMTAVSVPSPVTLGDPFDVTFDIAAIGNQTLSSVGVQLFLSNAHALSASIDGGTCDTTPNFSQLAFCTTGPLAPRAPLRLRARLVSDRVGIEGITLQAIEQGAGSGVILNTALITQPAHDIAVWADQEDRRTAIGVPATWQLEVRSAGAYAVDNVHVRLDISAHHLNPQLSGPLAALCTLTTPDVYDCNLGTLSGGAVVAGQLTASSNIPGGGAFAFQVVPLQADDESANDSLLLDLEVRAVSEISVFASGFHGTFDGRPASMFASVDAGGIGNSENVRLDIALPASFSISSASLAQNPCTLQASARHLATCTLASLAADESATLTIAYEAAAPGVYTGTLTVSADEDFNAANNVATLDFHVAPNVDGAMLPPSSPPPVLRTDQAAVLTFTATSNKYALTDARIDFNWVGALDEFSASGPGATCAASDTGYSCELGTLPPNSSVPIHVQTRSSVATQVQIGAFLTSPAETQFTDNYAAVIFSYLEPGDVAVGVAQSTLDATRGRQVQVIFDVNTLAPVVGGFLEIGVDATLIESPSLLISSNCFQLAATIRCTTAPGTYTENFSFVPRSAGPLRITLRVGGQNDFNPSNDTAVVTVNVADPPAPPPPPPSGGGGGGGGGGSMNWLLAALLLTMWHHRRARFRVHR